MKKVFSVIFALFMALSINAAERGKFIHVDASVNKNLKPQLAFAQTHVDGEDITTLLVQTVNVNNFNEFSDASRILMRFADDSKTVRLNRVAGSPVNTRKYSKKQGNATISFYETVTEYEVAPEVLEKLEAGIAIIKVRVVFKENESKDYDIIEGYQPKMAADLYKSYLEAVDKNKKSHSDTSDDDF
jgi:hypothetical protein